jgi:hypothetical protein
MADEISELREKVKISEARFEDLKRSVDARSTRTPKTPKIDASAEVVELVPLPPRRA